MHVNIIYTTVFKLWFIVCMFMLVLVGTSWMRKGKTTFLGVVSVATQLSESNFLTCSMDRIASVAFEPS